MGVSSSTGVNKVHRLYLVRPPNALSTAVLQFLPRGRIYSGEETRYGSSRPKPVTKHKTLFFFHRHHHHHQHEMSCICRISSRVNGVAAGLIFSAVTFYDSSGLEQNSNVFTCCGDHIVRNATVVLRNQNRASVRYSLRMRQDSTLFSCGVFVAGHLQYPHTRKSSTMFQK